MTDDEVKIWNAAVEACATAVENAGHRFRRSFLDEANAQTYMAIHTATDCCVRAVQKQKLKQSLVCAPA